MSRSQQRRGHGRAAFTAVELVLVLAVALAVIGAGSSAMLPSLRKAALNESLATIEEACRSARHLAMSERDASAPYYGVVIYRDGGQTWVGVTQGASATASMGAGTAAGALALAPDGSPRFRARLVESVGMWSGASHAGASFLDDGQAVGWLYHHRTGYLSASDGLNVTPTFVGVAPATLAAEGVNGTSMLGALSLRSLDGTRGRAIEIYASGIMSAKEL